MNDMFGQQILIVTGNHREYVYVRGIEHRDGAYHLTCSTNAQEDT